MTAPAILLGILLSTVYGTAFHVLKGGSIYRIVLFILLSWAGFWAGHFIGSLLKWNFAAIGSLNTGMATLGSLIFLFVGEWLSRIEITNK